MILMRFDDLEGKYCEVEGGKSISSTYGYNQSKAGWLPIETVNFGFKTASEAKAGAAGGAGTAGQAGNGAATSSAAGAQAGVQAGANAAGATEDGAFQHIQVMRFVDGATTSLMSFAMEDRNKKKSDRELEGRKVDVHFLHSVQSLDGFIYPYLMITLDRVLVKGWSINASGDDRPGENLELWYDRAAMRYYRTIDGAVWIGGDVSGWDQYKNEEWKPSDGEAKYFVQPKH